MAGALVLPNATVSGTGHTVTGAATAHEALGDLQDTSWVDLGTLGSNITVGFPSSAIPSGSVVKTVHVGVRMARLAAVSPLKIESAWVHVDGSGTLDAEPVVSWTSPATVWQTRTVSPLRTGFQGGTIRLAPAAGPIRVHEAVFQIVYVPRPTVTVTDPLPNATIQDTNMPTIEWAATLDGDGGPQTYWRVVIASEAQYTAPGYNPATDGGVVDSGDVPGDATRWTVNQPLPDGLYRAYVWVGQTVNGEIVWTDVNSPGTVDFEIDVLLPGVPIVTATGQDSLARIEIKIEGQAGDVTTDAFEVERSVDGGATWQRVRTLREDGLIDWVWPHAAIFDFEAPIGVEVHYRARALHDYAGLWAASDWSAPDSASWSSDRVWLKHPNQPVLNTSVTVQSLEIERPGRAGVFQPIGASLPIVVSDTRSGQQGQIVFRTDNAQERQRLDRLLDTVDTLLLQFPPEMGEPDRHIRCGDHGRQRMTQRATVTVRSEPVTWWQVDPPLGPVTEWPA